MLFLKNYLKLSKFGIVVLVLLTSALGYFSADPFHYSYKILGLLILGVYFVSSGSFILNQAYEFQLDKQMDRTKTRPIPQGFISKKTAGLLGLSFVVLGLSILFQVNFLTVLLSLTTILLYNFFYTLRWKKSYPYAAVFFGAVPGALPVVIGYCAGSSSFLQLKCVYLFLIMFLWQMPHFWSLAFHYKKDYAKAKIPVLPNAFGEDKTFFHIGLYTLAYLGTVLLAPFFLKTGWIYFIVALPFCIKIMVEFYRFYNHKKGLLFFSWLNISLLVFLSIPLLDWWAVSQLFNI